MRIRPRALVISHPSASRGRAPVSLAVSAKTTSLSLHAPTLPCTQHSEPMAGRLSRASDTDRPKHRLRGSFESSNLPSRAASCSDGVAELRLVRPSGVLPVSAYQVCCCCSMRCHAGRLAISFKSAAAPHTSQHVGGGHSSVLACLGDSERRLLRRPEMRSNSTLPPAHCTAKCNQLKSAVIGKKRLHRGKASQRLYDGVVRTFTRHGGAGSTT